MPQEFSYPMANDCQNHPILHVITLIITVFCPEEYHTPASVHQILLIINGREDHLCPMKRWDIQEKWPCAVYMSNITRNIASPLCECCNHWVQLFYTTVTNMNSRPIPYIAPCCKQLSPLTTPPPTTQPPVSAIDQGLALKIPISTATDSETSFRKSLVSRNKRHPHRNNNRTSISHSMPLKQRE